MAVYLGDHKNQSAVKSALKINFAVAEIINPLVKTILESDYKLEHVVGVDTSPVLVAQTGVRVQKTSFGSVALQITPRNFVPCLRPMRLG